MREADFISRGPGRRMRRALAIMAVALTFVIFSSIPAHAQTSSVLCSDLPAHPETLPIDGGFQGGFWGADSPTHDYFRLLVTCEDVG